MRVGHRAANISRRGCRTVSGVRALFPRLPKLGILLAHIRRERVLDVPHPYRYNQL